MLIMPMYVSQPIIVVHCQMYTVYNINLHMLNAFLPGTRAELLAAGHLHSLQQRAGPRNTVPELQGRVAKRCCMHGAKNVLHA